MWSEKYRPKKVNDIIGDFTDKIKKYLDNPKAIPHFLLYSRTPGTGKTTLMKAIVNELGCDYILLNSSDDRKIDVVREKVKEFSQTQSSKTNLKRAVLMDEFDGMLKASQEALRNVMETYSSNVFFILTCNNINKVIDPLKNRCIMIPFSYPKKEDIYKYLIMICENEQLDYTEEGVKKLIDLNYPSIRNCVLKLQDIKTDGCNVTIETVKPFNEEFERLYLKLKQKDWIFVKRIILESTINAREFNTYIWEKALDENNIKLIQLTCRNEKDISGGADEKIIVVTSLIEIVKTFI